MLTWLLVTAVALAALLIGIFVRGLFDLRARAMRIIYSLAAGYVSLPAIALVIGAHLRSANLGFYADVVEKLNTFDAGAGGAAIVIVAMILIAVLASLHSGKAVSRPLNLESALSEISMQCNADGLNNLVYEIAVRGIFIWQYSRRRHISKLVYGENSERDSVDEFASKRVITAKRTVRAKLFLAKTSLSAAKIL